MLNANAALGGVVGLQYTLTSFEQPSTKLDPMSVTFGGMVMLASLLQLANAYEPIVVTPLPRAMLQRLVQPLNVR